MHSDEDRRVVAHGGDGVKVDVHGRLFRDVFDRPMSVGDLVVRQHNPYMSSFGRVHSFTKQMVRVQFASRRWGGEGWELSDKTQCYEAGNLLIVPYVEALPPTCSACGGRLSPWGDDKERTWMCQSNECGAMYEWGAPLEILFPQLAAA